VLAINLERGSLKNYFERIEKNWPSIFFVSFFFVADSKHGLRFVVLFNELAVGTKVFFAHIVCTKSCLPKK
jgi:hypothetical protein